MTFITDYVTITAYYIMIIAMGSCAKYNEPQQIKCVKSLRGMCNRLIGKLDESKSLDHQG